jgi:signal peptidase II
MMRFAKRLALISFVLVACVGCDRVTKSIAMAVLPNTLPWSLFGDTVRLQVIYNHGAFLSLGASLPVVWRQAILMIGVGCLLAGALTYAFVSKPGHPPVVLAIALVCAGGLGNLWDRVVHGGMVVDFINIGIGSVRTGIFNVADIVIVVGVLMFIANGWQRQGRAP